MLLLVWELQKEKKEKAKEKNTESWQEGDFVYAHILTTSRLSEAQPGRLLNL